VLTIYDVKGSMNLNIADSDFFVDGEYLGGNHGLCYVPVFMDGLGKVNEWTIGSSIMK